MIRLLNTLYVMTSGAYLSKDGESVTVSVDHEEKLRVPIHILSSIVCFGHVTCTPYLLGLCGKNQVAVSFMTENGRFLARLHGPVHGNVLLRREQYRRADDRERAATIARIVVLGKIANCRCVLQRAARDRPSSPAAGPLTESAERLARIIERLNEDTDLESVRGVEGIAAAEYFSVFDNMISVQKDDFQFHTRSRRPPLDRVNALLSFLYTLLTHDVASALEGVGLDPAVGFLHSDRPGRPSLALDLVEELRPVLADRIALALINRKQITKGNFRITESGAVMLNDEGRKRVLVTYQERKREELTHPFLQEKFEIGLLPHAQALLLARHLRGDLDGYPPFLWK